MKPAIFAITLFVLASAACAGARAQTDALKPIFQERYAAMKTAMESHNDKALTAMLAPGFTSVDVNGQTEDAAGMIAEVDALKIDPNRVSTTTILSVTPVDNGVVVRQRYDMKKTKAALDGLPQHIELITDSTDTWIKGPRAWVLSRTQTDTMDYFVNGQRLVHKIKPA
jgi:hypothetical protein